MGWLKKLNRHPSVESRIMTTSERAKSTEQQQMQRLNKRLNKGK